MIPDHMSPRMVLRIERVRYTASLTPLSLSISLPSCLCVLVAGRGQVSVGAELSVAVGPVGRTGAGNVSVAAEGLAHAYSCKCCKCPR